MTGAQRFGCEHQVPGVPLGSVLCWKVKVGGAPSLAGVSLGRPF